MERRSPNVRGYCNIGNDLGRTECVPPVVRSEINMRSFYLYQELEGELLSTHLTLTAHKLF